MQQVRISIKDDKKGKSLIDFLKKLDFIDIYLEKQNIKGKDFSNFQKIAGIWKNKKIDLHTIRKKAWRNGIS